MICDARDRSARARDERVFLLLERALRLSETARRELPRARCPASERERLRCAGALQRGSALCLRRSAAMRTRKPRVRAMMMPMPLRRAAAR